MALRGTLKDFGIADIFQLIGHQGKTGVLAVRNRDQEVQIYFKDGSVVRAHSATRQKRELLGRMLVRAEVLTDEQLASALDNQKKTLRRLGDILVEQGAVDPKTLRAFARLQTTETIYQLFLWDAGHYEFKQADVELEEGIEAIRSENVLMEGFRQVDEWPMIRRRITGYGITFEKLEDLDALAATAGSDEPATADDDGFGDLDDAFGEFESQASSGDSRLKNIGQNERIVYQLIIGDRDVQKLIDLSRLGEFETCKALVALIHAGIIAPRREGRRRPSASSIVGGIHGSKKASWVPTVVRVALYLALVAGVVVGALSLGVSSEWLAAARANKGYMRVELRTAISRGQIGRLDNALAVYAAEKGSYPRSLDQLVEAGLLEPRDLSFPWKQRYHYRRTGDSYEILRPLY
jgi:hypothetical protein